MPLNLTVNDGDNTPYIKYNAKAGRWYIRPQGASEDIEIDKPRLAIDMAHIRTGWILYQEGMGPEKVWDPSPTQMAARPAGPRKFKRGFEVMVYGNDPIPGIGKLGLREFSSTAANAITAILSMYAEYERGMASHPNQVPYYVCLGVKAITGAYGTNYEPKFELKGWVGRDKIPAFNAPASDAEIGWEEAPPLTEDPFAPIAGPVNVMSNARQTVGGGSTVKELDDDIPFAPEWR
jgi:hypothetical protein